MPRLQSNVWRRRCVFLILAWCATTVCMSFPSLRGVVAYPLYEHDDQSAGDAAYVMADGAAYWERLRAASDLYHWKRVPRILIPDEQIKSNYNFVRRENDTLTQRALDYLKMYGVPAEAVTPVPYDVSANFSSLGEAQSVAKKFPDLRSIVVVTSAPHTRRSKLCFDRVYSNKDIDVHVYAASGLSQSTEITSPIWIEYLKLVVYFFSA